MNIKNLSDYIEQNGNEFKSYRHLCEVLGVKERAGNSRPAQKKEFERFIKLEKGDGNGWFVREIYKIPKPKKGNNVYGGLAQLLLTDYFMKTKKENLTISRNYLLQQINMINENYSKNRKDVQTYALNKDINTEIAYDFFDSSDGIFRNVIETALKSLENQALILYTDDIIVIPVNSENHRAATANEKSIILEIRDDLLKELGYKTIRDILHSSDRNNYINKMDEMTAERIGIKKNYTGYNITILQKRIAEKQQKMIINYLSDAESKGYKEELNNLVIGRLIKNATNRQLKAINKKPVITKVAFGNDIIDYKYTNKERVRIKDDYLPSISKMVEHNIKSIDQKVIEIENGLNEFFDDIEMIFKN